ncbi:MAG TPA: malto-oligosyltrehalose synthase [Methanotrichaceae archaeon]|nr:malto-oligosyltrehalose synthase [Methanotrichaceae archaeon]
MDGTVLRPGGPNVREDPLMRVPVATYRLQFNSSFGFRAAKDLVPYLADLGISDIYASPIFRAREGSTHGYDVADHNQINPEIGSREDFLGLIGALKARGMGLLQDMIPNHMAYSIENPMIADIFERGESSRYYPFFDVDWNYRHANLRGRISAPFLGEHYGDALEKREISLTFNQSGFAVDYHGLLFPLRLKSYAKVLGLKEEPEDQELAALRDLILQASECPENASELKKRLWELYGGSRGFKDLLDSRLKAFKGDIGRPESFDLLDSLLLEQLFCLSFWKTASQEINYRRFFTINDLISLRAERREVFDHIHSMLFEMVARGEVNGIRVDHIDGLYDPKGYLERLREHIGDLYVVVEKILGWNEDLPAWSVQGTTGYDFLNYLNGIFCNKENAFAFDEIYRRFTGLNELYEDVVYEKKRLMLERYMGGEVDNLTHHLKDLAERDRHGRDLTLSGLKKALGEFMVGLSVYRTYMDSGGPSDKDRFVVQRALEMARGRRPDLFKEIDFLEHILMEPLMKSLTEPLMESSRQEEGKSECRSECRSECMKFVSRLSQFTGPLMAKGFEDTVLYYYNRLISLNEVGGSPERFGTSQEEFHSFNAIRAKCWPGSLNATSTHDTKRGEDARARINVLSEIPGEWVNALRRWRRMNEPMKRNLNGRLVPDRNEEYSLYQSLIGALPFFHDDSEEYPHFLARAKGYLVKALREAKMHSDWMDSNPAYEEAFIAFFQDIMEPSTDFFEDFTAFQRNVALFGLQNSLSQTLLKIASPGVPDFYQGTELWDYSFVDPDNRRPVDFTIRKSYLEEIMRREEKGLLRLIEELLENKEDGRIKLFLIHRALLARGANADLFRLGQYMPLKAEGTHKEKIIAFARVHDGSWALALAPRFSASRGESWGDTSLILPKAAPMRWRDAITGNDLVGGRLSLEEAFEHFPVALFLGREG